ncbi:MAG: ImmA/IrrE family metallo-endopeptidase [Bdellovibrionales bacterium]|nr:ImmA/IrrE family metallo-endopeptidase [Bdellovibrionales bacterium]
MKDIGKKLKELRVSKGLSGDEVAKLIGRSGNYVISRIESGETKLSLEVFDKLCKVYEVPPASLFDVKKSFGKKKGFFDRVSYRADEGNIPEELKLKLQPHLKDLRRIGNLQKKLDRLPFNHREIYKVDLDEKLPLKKQKEVAKGLARQLREKMGADIDDELDIVDFISNKLNISILGIDLGELMWGFYSKDIYGHPLIVFNENNKFEGRKRFTLAHELGHYFLHNDFLEIDMEGDDQDEQKEKVVNAFAQELLVPSEHLRKYYDDVGFSLVRKIKPSHVAHLASKFKVSFLMMAYVLVDLGKINWNQYKEFDHYCKEKLEEEKDIIGYTTPDYVVRVKPLRQKIMDLAIEAKAKEVIGIDELSKLADMNTQELAKVL